MKFERLKLAAALRRARERNRMTQAGLAKAAGLKTSAVSHFESGRRTPCVRNLVLLSDHLQVSVDQLLGRA